MRAESKVFWIVGVLPVALVSLWLIARGHQDSIERDPDILSVGDGDCPAGVSDSGLGPDMVRMPQDFCIDKTEVTRAQYRTWLETSPAVGGQTGACSQNDDFTPSCLWPPASADENKPVVCVDWCDAKAFCEAAGKRLCGRIGDGTAYPFEDYDDPSISEWHAACSSGGSYDYPYGDTLDTTICRGADAEDYTTWGIVEAASQSGCHSPDAPYSQLYDLSGNAAEWDNSCDGDAADDGCHIRGGSYQHNEHGLRCAMARDLRWPRTRRHQAIGFRCCAD